MYVIRLNRLIAMFAIILIVAVIAVSAHTVVEIAATDGEGIDVPILMYHSILKNSNGNKYIVSPSGFENDLKFLGENGYTTIVMQDLIDYVYEGKELPPKPAILTFDDGYYNNYVYIYPLLKEYNAKAVISIVGSYADLYTQQKDTNPNYAHLSWEVIREMSDSGLVEFQNHTYNFHSFDKGRKGCKKNRGESVEEYTRILTEDVGSMQEKCLEQLGSTPTTFTYPFGFVCDESFEIIKELGFKASLSCQEGINRLGRDPDELYMLKRCIRTPKRSARDILKD